MASSREGRARQAGAGASNGNGNGHLLNTMDNAAFERDANGEMPLRIAPNSATVEMGEFGAAPRPAGRPTPHGAPLCKPDLCRAMAPPQAIVAKPPVPRPNPWHRYKTVLLVATVAGLIIWAVAYLALEYYDIM